MSSTTLIYCRIPILIAAMLSFGLAGCSSEESESPPVKVQEDENRSAVEEANSESSKQTDSEVTNQSRWPGEDDLMVSSGEVNITLALSGMIKISAALDYWNQGEEPVVQVHFDSSDKQVKDDRGNRLNLSEDTWKHIVHWIALQMKKDPRGSPIRSTQYDRYNATTKSIDRGTTPRFREMARHVYFITVENEDDPTKATLDFSVHSRLDN